MTGKHGIIQKCHWMLAESHDKEGIDDIDPTCSCFYWPEHTHSHGFHIQLLQIVQRLKCAEVREGKLN